MLRSKLRVFLLITLALVISCGIFIFGAFAYRVPSSPVSVALLKIAYSLTPDKKLFLEFFSPVKRDVAAGYLPADVDSFLCQRVEQTDDQDEIAAIAHFYTIQAGGREGGCVYAGSDSARQKIIAQLIEDLNSDELFESKLILLEEIRKGESLGKGRAGVKVSEDISAPHSIQWERVTGQHISLARDKYRAWWNSDKIWDEKKKINPLKNTNISVSYCCG